MSDPLSIIFLVDYAEWILENLEFLSSGDIALPTFDEYLEQAYSDVSEGND